MAVPSIKYPVDIQSFPIIREEGYLYVDKTELVYRLANNHYYVFLSRPRRFGKTLLMSTLEAYFKGRKELFKGLAIERLEENWESFPVLRFDLSTENFKDIRRVTSHLSGDLKDFEEEYGCVSDGSISQRFKRLIKHIFVKTGRRVVVLIDEYDKPLLETMTDVELHEEVIDELRAFYSVLKASNEFVRFVMLTGVTKFGKVSIFSGLNNLKDISMLPSYNSVCGITEREFHDVFRPSIFEYSGHAGMTEAEVCERFKAYYDGYHFAIPGEEIYNPFSVLNAFEDRKMEEYWYSSGSSSFLVRLISSNNYPLIDLEGALRSRAELNDITEMRSDVVPLLYQSGYLTLKGYDEEAGKYILGFPNQEVYKSFWNSLSRHFFPFSESFSNVGLCRN